METSSGGILKVTNGGAPLTDKDERIVPSGDIDGNFARFFIGRCILTGENIDTHIVEGRSGGLFGLLGLLFGLFMSHFLPLFDDGDCFPVFDGGGRFGLDRFAIIVIEDGLLLLTFTLLLLTGGGGAI